MTMVEMVAEQAALVWTLRSQARVGSYQHEVSSAPWMILAAEDAALAALDMPVRGDLSPAERDLGGEG